MKKALYYIEQGKLTYYYNGKQITRQNLTEQQARALIYEAGIFFEDVQKLEIIPNPKI